MAAKKKSKKKVTKKKAGKKKVVKKKAAKKKGKKKLGGKKSKAVILTKEGKENAMYGNSFWLKRSTHGRKPIFSKPTELFDACLQYFQWVEENPLKEEKVFHTDGRVTKTTVDKMRAMTQEGLCTFIDISQETWSQYRQKKDFTEVCEAVDSIMYDQKLTGASANMLNASIIARYLGLKDKTEQSGVIGHVDLTGKSDQELKDIVSGKKTA